MPSDTVTLLSNTKLGTQNSNADLNNVMVPRGIEVPDVQAPTRDASAPQNDNTSTSGRQKDLHEVVAQAENVVQNMRRNLSFSVEQDTGQTIIRVTDAETDEVIRQIPSEEFLKIAEALEKTKSLLYGSEV